MRDRFFEQDEGWINGQSNIDNFAYLIGDNRFSGKVSVSADESLSAATTAVAMWIRFTWTDEERTRDRERETNLKPNLHSVRERRADVTKRHCS